MSRRKGRVLAFQALYSYDVGGLTLDSLLELEWDQKDKSEMETGLAGSLADSALESESEDELKSESDTETKDYARLLIAGTINHLDAVDEAIKKHLSAKWEIGRLNKVTLAILRLSVFELLYQKDLAATIVIDEAIRIAKDYGADDAYKFINAILDSISKDVPRS